MLGGDRSPRARAAPEAPPSGTARSYALMRLRQEQISARGELVATSGGYTARWVSCVPAARRAGAPGPFYVNKRPWRRLQALLIAVCGHMPCGESKACRCRTYSGR